MIHSWSPEQVVQPELPRSLIDSQFPELRGCTVEPFGTGWDNTAYLVNGSLVFRFPRRAVAVELIEVEARVLPRIAPTLPLQVPVPGWVGRPDQGYPLPTDRDPTAGGGHCHYGPLGRWAALDFLNGSNDGYRARQTLTG